MARQAPTQNTPTSQIAAAIDNLTTVFANQRKTFERHWYDNNFFDDGHHFRYVSRSTGKIIDLSKRQDLNMPERAIPKASRQIRGIANLLLALNPHPTIYPEPITQSNYPNPADYQAALQISKTTAKKVGGWLEEEWRNQGLKEKLIQMIILAAKNSVSYLEVWPDAVEEKIRTQVYDAFDVYLMGNLTDMYESPAIIKAIPQRIVVIRANEDFDPDQRLKLSPDNKYASSEIKQAYLQTKFGAAINSDEAATIILKEAFLKEYLTEDNWDDVKELGKEHDVLKGKKIGDMVMRHTFTAGGVWLKDEYVDLPDYPFVSFRMEPGPIYQIPLMERFIPANKSLDIAMSRIERYMNSMVAGIWLRRKGENFQITNAPGGQLVEYEGTPPTQAQMGNIPSFAFNYINQLNQIIEEQGASASALNVLPDGVKSGVAIESVKQTEYSNLKMSSDMLKNTVKTICEKFLDIADNYFVSPQTTMLMDQGEPQYFDVIGNNALKTRKKSKIGLPSGVVPLKKEYKVDIEIESDMGYTMEGKRNTMQQIITLLVQLAGQQLVSPQAVKLVVTKFLETFQFGSTQEFMDAMDQTGQTQGLDDKQLMQMKIASAEAMKDMNVVGPQADQKMIQMIKVGVLEAMKESGMANSMGQQQPLQPPAKQPSESISFKDLPPMGKVQMAAKAGIQLSPVDPELQSKPVGGKNAA